MTDKIKEIIIKEYSEYLGINPDDAESMIEIHGPCDNYYRIRFFQEEYRHMVIYLNIRLCPTIIELYQVSGGLYVNHADKKRLENISRYKTISREKEIVSCIKKIFLLSLQRIDSFLYASNNKKER